MTARLLAPVIPSSAVPSGRQRTRRPGTDRCRWPAPVPAPLAPEDVVYGIGRIDSSGRIADRTVTTALGWRGGDRLTVTAVPASASTGVRPVPGSYQLPYGHLNHVDQITANWLQPTRQRVRHRTLTPLHAGRRKTAADSVLPAAVPVDHAARTEHPDLAQAPVVRRGQADPTRAG